MKLTKEQVNDIAKDFDKMGLCSSPTQDGLNASVWAGKLLDHIQALQEENERLTAWISVDDDLPKGRNEWGSKWWLVKAVGEIPQIALFHKNRWERENGNPYYMITHWRAIPSSPAQRKFAIPDDGPKDGIAPPDR